MKPEGEEEKILYLNGKVTFRNNSIDHNNITTVASEIMFTNSSRKSLISEGASLLTARVMIGS